MPAARTLLPEEPPVDWVKPTLSNTHNGKTYIPTHPDLLKVVFSSTGKTPVATDGITASLNPSTDAEDAKTMEEGFTSSLVAVRDFKPNEIITTLTNVCLAPEKAYSSVQFGVGPRDHLELNSDLLFMNHSCAPTVNVILPHLRPEQWVIRAGPAGLQEGQDLTFFYPSTEWDMAQGFDCACGAKTCLGSIRGARYLSLEELEKRGFVNDHIRTLKTAQEENHGLPN